MIEKSESLTECGKEILWVGKILASVISAYLLALGVLGFFLVSKAPREWVAINSIVILVSFAVVVVAILSWKTLSVVIGRKLLELEKNPHG